MRLRKRKKNEEREAGKCAASRCKKDSVTSLEPNNKLDSIEVELCEGHWQTYQDEDPPTDEELAAAKKYVNEAVQKMNKLAPGQENIKPGEWVFQHTDDGLKLVE